MRNKLLIALVSAGVGFSAAVLWINRGPPPGPLPAAATLPVESPAVMLEIPTATNDAPSARTPARQVPVSAETPPTPTQRGFPEILAELATIQVTPGPAQGRAQYRVLALLDQLAQGGPTALPALRAFLASNRDVAYAPAGRAAQGNSMLPPSLRFGLFDVARQIGGAEAEQVLVESLQATARGAEFAYLAQLLEELGPGKHRDTVLAAARSLLASGKVPDVADRNNLYDVLQQFKDTSFVATAQAGLVQADGKVDRSALRYLQQSLGDKTVALASQTYQDTRVVDPESKAALGRVALTYVGANDQALELYHKAALDPKLTENQRRNLIEDLNEDGLTNRRNPTPEDLKVIARRYELTQAYLQQEYVKQDKVLSDSFQEAKKDLRNFLVRAGQLPAANPK